MITIRPYKKDYACDCGKLISSVFRKYNSEEGTIEGVNNYIGFFDPKKNSKNDLIELFNFTKIFFVAIINNKIVGLIRGTEDRIINLYVDGKHHKKGIGKKLLTAFEKDVFKKGITKIKVRASLYAINFYKKHGYKKTTGIRCLINLNFQPMVKVL